MVSQDTDGRRFGAVLGTGVGMPRIDEVSGRRRAKWHRSFWRVELDSAFSQIFTCINKLC